MTRSRIDEAIALRSPLLTPENDAVRLIDGAADGFADCFVESLAGRILTSTAGDAIPPAIAAWMRDGEAPAYHKRLDSREKESPRHCCGPPQTQPFAVTEHGLRFLMSFDWGYSQGLFLDQRDNRRALRDRCKPGDTVLNTFAYTGAFSVNAAAAGAVTTTLDLSQPCLDRATANFTLNGIDPATHHFCRGDSFHWLRRFAKQGRKFTGIVLDPPTFSRARDGTVFRAERDFGELAALAADVCAPDGWILCCTNFRGIGSADFTRLLRGKLPRPFRARLSMMPPDFRGDPYLKTVWLER